MSEKDKTKPRECANCGAILLTTAHGIKEYEIGCKGGKQA